MDIDHPYWKVSRSPPTIDLIAETLQHRKGYKHKQWEFHRWASWWWNQRWIKDWIWGWFVSSRAIAAGLLYRVLPNHDSWGTILFRRCKSDTWAREKAQNDTIDGDSLGHRNYTVVGGEGFKTSFFGMTYLILLLSWSLFSWILFVFVHFSLLEPSSPVQLLLFSHWMISFSITPVSYADMSTWAEGH